MRRVSSLVRQEVRPHDHLSHRKARHSGHAYFHGTRFFGCRCYDFGDRGFVVSTATAESFFETDSEHDGHRQQR